MQVDIIPALQDNYIYALRFEKSKRVIIIDPGEVLAVESYLESEGLILDKILLTHHHFDHILFG